MKTKSILISNLEWLMKKKKLNTSSLAKVSKVSQATIFRILTGESNDPRIASIKPLADYFNLSIEQLRFHDLTTSEHTKENKKIMGYVPIITWTQAGNFKKIFENDASEFNWEWIEAIVRPNKYTFALKVRGDSMSPLFIEEDIIIVEPDIQAENGDFVIIRKNNEEATFKKLVQDGEDWYLKPINQDYKTKIMSTEDLLCGVVRAKQRIFK